jgi:hypothetical protein
MLARVPDALAVFLDQARDLLNMIFVQLVRSLENALEKQVT